MNGPDAITQFTLNSEPVGATFPRGTRLSQRTARRARPDRHQDRLRRRRLRRLHGAARWRAGLRLPGAVRPGRGPRGDDRRRASAASGSSSTRCRRRSSRTARPNAASARPACWWPPPRLLAAQRRSRPRHEVDGRARRRAVPLHRLPQDHRGGAGAPTRTAAGRARRRRARRSARAWRGSTAAEGRPARESFGADGFPADALLAARRPLARITARASASAISRLRRRASRASSRVLTAADVPGHNCFGVIPTFADQPVLRRRRGALSRRGGRRRGRRARARSTISDLGDFPVDWEELPPLLSIDAALADGAPTCIHADRPDNVLASGRVVRGDAEAALAESGMSSSRADSRPASSSTPISSRRPAGPRRVGDRIEVHACTQAPYMDRDDIAQCSASRRKRCASCRPRSAAASARKLDLSVQPLSSALRWR